MMKERKRTYTEEEVNELKKWFDSQSLPPTMQIDRCFYSHIKAHSIVVNSW